MSGSTINWFDASPGQGSISYRVVDSGGLKSDIVSFSVITTAEPKPPQNLSLSGSFAYKAGISGQSGYNQSYASGRITANDPDGNNADLIYSGNANSGGTLTINPETGAFTYRGSNAGTSFVFRVKDSDGYIVEKSFSPNFSFAGTYMNPASAFPIVFDLNQNGLALTAAASDAVAKYDWDEDGLLNPTGWIAGEGDALLAYDYDGDGIIQHKNEISFVDYLEGAKTDLEGLRAFDTDGDGMFSANDAQWGEFGLWRDDGDALSETGEFQSLTAMGVESINLTSDGNVENINGNTVHGMTEVMMTDGSTLEAGDVTFRYLGDDTPSDEMFTELVVDVVDDETALAEEQALADEAEAEEKANAKEKERAEEQAEAEEKAEAETETAEAEEREAAEEKEDADDGLPSDEELDRMALQNASDAAAMPPSDTVAEVDTDPDGVVPPSDASTTDDENVPLG